MKEMFKSKYLVLFIVLMLGVTYFNSLGIERLNNNVPNQNEIIINK